MTTPISDSKAELHISVRNLVEFLMRCGDLDNRHTASSEQAMLAGSRIHREIQRSMGEEYQAEIPLAYTHPFESYSLTASGRADGILISGTRVMIDEIKGTYRELKHIKEPVPVHLAQAKCYAFFYASQEGLSEIDVRMTYCHLETEEIKYFEESYSIDELRLWYEAVMEEYRKWTDYSYEWQTLRTASIRQLDFPFPYRNGQKELVTYVYQTIYHKRKLFLEAPTGVGKTVSTIFPAVKAVGEGYGDKLFYLTAKTITRTVAADCFELLRAQGLRFKSVILTAKDKICPCEETVCNPDACPYAKGHYDRINDAIFDCLTQEENFSREVIEHYAVKHRVCPFEMSLDMSLYSDAVICDYNYVFDPHVYLKRFFADGITKPYLFLVDEAHNLVDRGRGMYSAELYKGDLLELKNTIQKGLSEREKLSAHEEHSDILYKLVKQLEKCNKELVGLKRACEEYELEPSLGQLTLLLERLGSTMEEYLEESDTGEHAERENILDCYFEVSHFLMISELLDDHYMPYTQLCENGDFLVRLFCVDPSKNLKLCMDRARSTILFSATLLPILYYKKLLGGDAEDYEVYAGSAFDPEKKGLFIATDVTSKYTSRSASEYRKIASYIRSIVERRYGNYMIFFPSYQFLQNVYDCFVEEQYDEGFMECVVQDSSMKEEAREAFLKRFEGNEECDLNEKIAFDIDYEEDKCLLGFCVLGGMFSEGIDLKKDALIGAVIIGTGLPQIGLEQSILKEYFDQEDGNGFDYAYRYPGMNKVLQAAGRVIRTAEDIGIVTLLDYRFLQPDYKKMFPREWESFEAVSRENIGERIDRFWNEWL